jgi:hypothetical protein
VTGHTSSPSPEELKPNVEEFFEAPKPEQPDVPSSFRRFTHCYRCCKGPLWFPAFSEGQHYGDSS